MKKICPRCGSEFDCLHDRIMDCGCSKVKMSPEARDFLGRKYPGQCLCRSCLEAVVETVKDMGSDEKKPSPAC